MAHPATLTRIAKLVRQGLRVPEALSKASQLGYSSGSKARQWEDLRFSGASLQTHSLYPDFDATNGVWLFDATNTELVYQQAQMPHSWAEGTTLMPHVHWQKTTSASGNVMWRFSYKWAPIGEVMDAAFTDVDSTEVVPATPDNDTADEHLITTFGSLDATGKSMSDMLLLKIARIGGDAADTYGADARLLEVDIHYQIDSFGSNQEYTK